MFRRTPIVVALALILAAFAVACSSGGKSTVTVAPRPSPGCSQATLPAGESEQTLTVGAGTGTYRQMVPSAAATKKPLPLIIDIHGAPATAANQALVSGFETLGEQRGAFVLTPGGVGPGTPQPDVDFVIRLLDASEQRLCIDTARVFVDGSRPAAGSPRARDVSSRTGSQQSAWCPAFYSLPRVTHRGRCP